MELFENKAVEKYYNYHNYRLIGLFLFVATTIPTTGAYTDCIIAAMQGINYTIAPESHLAGLIVTALTGIVVSLL